MEPSWPFIGPFAGDLHLTGVLWREGVCHISISGTASYPCDYACYEVYEDRICGRVYGLPNDLTTADTNIHGKPRYEEDYVDESHPTPREYIAGNDSQRLFEIPLKNR